MNKKRIVVSLGGNALGDTLPEQMAAVKITAKSIADLIESGYQVIICHGNGPQVGMINNAMIELSRVDKKHPNTPLSVCVAMSEAYIGYDLQNALREELKNRNINNIPVTTLITQVRVDPADFAFEHPVKPIGYYMTKEQAETAFQKYGHIMQEYPGLGYRRIVPSPKPVEIVEMRTIKTLVNDGEIIIAGGGGGIPVVPIGNHLKGVSAVIDKDFVSCLLAKELNAQFLIILTTVEKAALNFGKPNEQWLSNITTEEATLYASQGHFAPGSMLPKIEAAIDFSQSGTGRTSLITLLEKASDAIAGKTGTRITKA